MACRDNAIIRRGRSCSLTRDTEYAGCSLLVGYQYTDYSWTNINAMPAASKNARKDDHASAQP